MNLNDEFAAFLKAEEAKRAPLDLGDWRERNAANAEANGDAYADAHPDTSLVASYYDPTEDEDDEFYFSELEPF